MGKSTSAQILAREEEYVYYEADCFAQMRNPYVPLGIIKTNIIKTLILSSDLDAEDPSMAQVKQKVLRGPGAKERQALVKEASKVFAQIMAQQPYDKVNM